MATVLPAGVRGIVVAGLLAALMSSLAGVFNASATLFTMDFYSKLRPNVSQHQLVWIGRVATIAHGAHRPGLDSRDPRRQRTLRLPAGRAGLSGPADLRGFLPGHLLETAQRAGCLAALIVGFIMGLFRLAIDTPVKLIDDFAYAEGSFLWIVNNMFFQYYSMLILAVCMIVMVLVSYMTREPDYSQSAA